VPCVETGARIHLGFYSVGDDAWGALGVYVDRPGFLVCSPPLKGWREDWITERLASRGYEAKYSVERSIPRHVGLGSTTQGVLAAAHAISIAEGRAFNPLEEAPLLGLGRISGTGILTYMYGGLVVGMGRDREGRHRLLARIEFPDEWRAILLLPRVEKGLSEDEEGFMTSMPPPSEMLGGGMARAAWMILRGVGMRRLSLLHEGMRLMEESVGTYFSKHQGGVFRKDLLGLVDRVRNMGIVVGQSSWGPLLYTFTRREDAGRIASLMLSAAREEGFEAEVWVAKGRNKPAGPVSEE